MRTGTIAAPVALTILAASTLHPRVSGAQPDGVPLTSARFREHLAILADDRMEGRETGTAGFDRAAAYVAAQFRALGLRPVNNQYQQPLTIQHTTVEEAGASLELVLASRSLSLAFGRDWVTYGAGTAPNVSRRGPVVFVGDGVTVEKTSIDAYRGLRAQGALVVALAGAPASLAGSARDFHASADAKAQNAAAHGARALLLVDEPGIDWTLRVQSARQLGVNQTVPSRRPTVPVVYINREAAATLLDPLAAHADGAAHLTFRQAVRPLRSANVFAIVPGTHPQRRREQVVIVAHLDHLGIGRSSASDAIFNGAVDNASGVAALLVLAEAFARRPAERSVLFLATTGEEQGEIGSTHFVRQLPMARRDLVAAVNIDGTAIVPFRSVDVAGGANSSLGAIARQAAEQLGMEVSLASLGVEGSDHAPFVAAAIPTIWPMAALPDGWMDGRYHTPQDDLQQPIDVNAAERYIRFVFASASLIANTAVRPQWNPGEFFSAPSPRFE